jgi:branched-chain amino acid transport system permease protein
MTVYLELALHGCIWGSLYVLGALGLNLIYGVMKVLNIAHGELVMLGAYATYWMVTLTGLSPLVSLVVVAPVFFVVGALIQRTTVMPVVRRSRSVEQLERGTLIAFFAVLVVLQNAALLAFTADFRVVEYLPDPVHVLGVSIAGRRLVVFLASLLITFALYGFLMHTRPGKVIRAVGQDREAAMLLSIDTDRVGMLSFGLGVALAGVAGSLLSLIYVITPNVGLVFTLKAFTIMIVGGLGNVMGNLAAGLVLGVAESLGSFVIGEGYREAFDYVVLLVVVVLVSRGIVRRREVG